MAVHLYRDPTETALLDFGVLYNYYKDEAEKNYPRVAEIPLTLTANG
jgi:hypothetical protein